MIGAGLKIPHAFDNVVITHFAKIGKNVTIYHDVTIGIIDGEHYQFGDIEIGDDVFIGTGVKILGKCKIGDGSKIGANSLIVSQDVPPFSLVVAPRAVILPGKLSKNRGEQ
ncbi:hypothetical protein I5907_04485 [Panacibacter sp. DH6]|uniref:Serine acetyltransferase n=1 Tax=Panacibacter microcysteis TaxID=2793269 RepID=A0A931GYD8_9BACT|nr:hypothetical protein [Panacibacter microcysteis]